MRLLFFWLVFAGSQAGDPAAGPPSIVLIVSDDQRPDTVHALGNAAIESPNLDRLAARGTAFTQAYAG